MLEGRLLTEKQPEILISELNCSTLEEAFLQLCSPDIVDAGKSEEETRHMLKTALKEDSQTNASNTQFNDAFNEGATLVTKGQVSNINNYKLRCRPRILVNYSRSP